MDCLTITDRINVYGLSGFCFLVSEGEINVMRIEDYMREWLSDCFCDPFSQDEIGECSISQVVRAVERYYAGGIYEFCVNTFTAETLGAME